MSSLYSFYKNTPGLQVKRDMDFSNVTIQCDPRLVVPDNSTNQTSGIFKKDTAGKIAVEHEICDLDVSNLTVNGQTTLNNATVNNATAANLAVSGTITGKKVVDGRFNTNAGLTDTLTASESGTLFLVDGTVANVITLPALSTSNVGVTYDFYLTVNQVAGTTTITIPGTGGLFQSSASIAGGAANTFTTGALFKKLTILNATVIGARVSITCVSDSGTASVWTATSVAGPAAVTNSA
jgi:hypothetical protein